MTPAPPGGYAEPMMKARSTHEALQWRGGKHRPRTEGFVSRVGVQQGLVSRTQRATSDLAEEGAVVCVTPIEPKGDGRTRPSGRIKLGS